MNHYSLHPQFSPTFYFAHSSSFSWCHTFLDNNVYAGLSNSRTPPSPKPHFFPSRLAFILPPFPVRPILSPSLLSSIFDRRCARYRFADSLCRKSQLQTPISAEVKERNLSRIFSRGFTRWKKDGSNDSFCYSILARFHRPLPEDSALSVAECSLWVTPFL